MKSHNKMNKTCGVLIFCIAFGIAFYGRTDPKSEIYWFIHVSDVHMGYGSSKTYLQNFCSGVIPTVDPFFVGETGDVCEGPAIYIGSQIESQWIDHRDVVETQYGFTVSFYRETPGNHDAVGDDAVDTNAPGPGDKLTAYKTWYALVGNQYGLHHTWGDTVAFGKIAAIGVDSVDDDQGIFQAAGRMMPAELTWIEGELQNNSDADIIFTFHHHPAGSLEGGEAEYRNLLDSYDVEVSFAGHTHNNVENKSLGTLYIETESFTKSSQRYRIFAVDSTVDNEGIYGISTVLSQLGTWPAVIITSPLDEWIASAAYCVPPSLHAQIRALVFDVNSPSSAEYNVDSGAWVPMVNSDGKLWDATWDTSSLSPGSHSLAVQATSASGTRNDTIIVNVCPNTAPTLTGLPDQQYMQDSGVHDNVIDLWAYADDLEDYDSEMTYTIVSETNTSLVDCSIDSNQYIDCTVQPGMTGSSDVNVRVTDTGALTDGDTFTVTVIESGCTPGSGPCCDESGSYRDVTYKCAEDMVSQYDCIDGTSCGDDVYVDYLDQYCSGSSEACDGSTAWEGWSISEDCTAFEVCSPGLQFCQDPGDGDGDGLHYCEEEYYGTSDSDADSDDDLMDDKYEVDNSLDPAVADSMTADFDGDGNPNVHEYFNGTLAGDILNPDPYCGPGGFCFGESGSLPTAGMIDGPDLTQVRFQLRGVSSDYSGVIPPNGDSADLNGTGIIDGPDVTIYRQVLSGSWGGDLTGAARYMNKTMPAGGSVIGGATIEVEVLTSATSGVPRSGYGVVFWIDSATGGTGAIYGGDGSGEPAGFPPGSRYDVTGTMAGGGKARIYLHVLTAGTIKVKAKIPANVLKHLPEVPSIGYYEMEFSATQ